MHPTTRTTPPYLPADERESLDSWLEFHRATLLTKCDGLDADQLATASCPPSTLSLLGLVRHLIGVEHWFHCFDGRPAMDPFPGEDEFVPQPAHASRDLRSYSEAVDRSREAVRDQSLDVVIDLPHWVADDCRRPFSRPHCGGSTST